MPIGSLTKAMTAAMIGELVAEGKMDWDKTPVVEYVPTAQFSPILTSELTLSDYLSHRTVSNIHPSLLCSLWSFFKVISNRFPLSLSTFYLFVSVKIS